MPRRNSGQVSPLPEILGSALDPNNIRQRLEQMNVWWGDTYSTNTLEIPDSDQQARQRARAFHEQLMQRRREGSDLLNRINDIPRLVRDDTLWEHYLNPSPVEKKAVAPKREDKVYSFEPARKLDLD